MRKLWIRIVFYVAKRTRATLRKTVCNCCLCALASWITSQNAYRHNKKHNNFLTCRSWFLRFHWLFTLKSKRSQFLTVFTTLLTKTAKPRSSNNWDSSCLDEAIKGPGEERKSKNMFQSVWWCSLTRYLRHFWHLYYQQLSGPTSAQRFDSQFTIQMACEFCQR